MNRAEKKLKKPKCFPGWELKNGGRHRWIGIGWYFWVAPPLLLLQETEFNNIDCSSLFWCWLTLLSWIETLPWSNSCELHEIILTDKDISVYCTQADTLEIKMCKRSSAQILHYFSMYLMHRDLPHRQSSFSTQARPEEAFTQLLLLLLDLSVSNSVFSLPNKVGKGAAAMTSKATPTAIVSLPLQCEEKLCSEAEIIFLTCPMKGFPWVTGEVAGVYSVTGRWMKVLKGKC